jgi:membrane protease YdiL (CAAX protease family)
MAFWVAAIAILIGAGMLRGAAPPAYSALLWGTLSTIGVVGLTIAFLRGERRGRDSVGLRCSSGSLPRFGAGAVIGLVLYALQIAIVGSIAGPLHLVPADTHSRAIALAVTTYMALATMEEVAFRGYPLRRLEERFGVLPAIAIGAIAFGILHLIYGWPPWMALAGATSGGVLFGAAALATRGLAVPVGLHASWNVAGWAVGEKNGAGVWRIVSSGDPERVTRVGNWTYLLVMAIGTAAFALFARYRRRSVIRSENPGGADAVPPGAP